MIPVANKPILQYVVESLVANGITRIVMVVGYKRTSIMNYFGNGEEFGASIEYVNEDKQLGTAHALYQARDKVSDQFLVLPGDNVISRKTISDLLKQRSEYSVLITRSDHPSKYGVVTMDDGMVADVVEKPEKSPGHIISTGIYALQPEVFDYIEEMMHERLFDITSVIHRMLEDHGLKGIITDSMWIDAVYPWDLLTVNSAALAQMVKSSSGNVERGVMIKGNVRIGEGAVIKGGCYIEGPAIIGEGCEIGPQACIMPSTSIGNDTKIGPLTLVKNSLVMKGVEVGPNSTVEQSVIGDGVNLGSNFCSHVGTREMVVEEGIKVLQSIGCMIAEDTAIGSGVTVKEGVIVGSKCSVSPGTVVRERIPSFSRIL